MKFLLTAVAFAICLVPSARAAEEENPFKNSKIGDWAEYKMTTTAMGLNIAGTLKMTVTAKNDNEVTLTQTMTLGDKEFPAPEVKVDLTKPYDPNSTTGLPKGTDAKVEKDGEGKEKIKVGGKEYDCKWQKVKMNAKVMDQAFDSEVKVWTSKDVPLSGMVKLEMKSKLADMTMELVKTGSK